MRTRAAEQRGRSIPFGLFGATTLLLAAVTLATVLTATHSLGALIRFGPLSEHMGHHIVLMNAAAPLAAGGLVLVLPATRIFSQGIAPLAWATTAQIVLLWGWHVPPVLASAWQSPLLLAAMHASLSLVAVVFWFAVFSIRGDDRWRPILALLVTGKLFCLLGALLVFAPRSLYATTHSGQAMETTAGLSALSDQQLAGLLMIVACPLTYVMAGVIIATRWVIEFDREPTPTPERA